MLLFVQDLLVIDASLNWNNVTPTLAKTTHCASSLTIPTTAIACQTTMVLIVNSNTMTVSCHRFQSKPHATSLQQFHENEEL